MEHFTDNALQILRERYFRRNKEGGIIEDPKALFTRVAVAIAKVEEKERGYWESIFFNLMNDLLFLPNSPTLMNAGVPAGQLSACFVLPVEDSLKSIFTTLTNASLIHQSGGGTGYNFSKLRPAGSLIDGSQGTSSGPVSFMKIYNEATRYVKQGGKRRGANMGILNIDHPDIEKFIGAKSDGISLENFNLSVGVSDEFMRCLERDELWALRDPVSGKITGKIRALKLWDAIIEAAWATGDPGLIFFDAINRSNPLRGDHHIDSTNPCGEVPLENFESCNLGSVNLAKMTRINNDQLSIDWAKLSTTVHHALRFLDNVITANTYLLPEVGEVTGTNRKVGLGVMGWAELLLLLGIPYASDKAIHLAGEVMGFIQRESYKASEKLAEERGVFPSWTESRFYPERKMRNATCNSIAPTGSISVIANTTYSIEPLYALSFTREGILNDQTQEVTMPLLHERLGALGYWDDRTSGLIRETGSLATADWIPENIRELFKTSMEIGWQYHLKHQKAFQDHTDNAVSKTINLPGDTPVEVIGEIYRKAWTYGLKGITIYRDHSKKEQVLNKSCGLYPTTC